MQGCRGSRNGHRLFGTRLRPSVVLPAECLSFPHPKSEERLNRTPRTSYGSQVRRGEGEQWKRRRPATSRT